MAKTIDIQSIITTQLCQYYSVIAQERETRLKIRNWAITTILAYVAIIGSGKIFILNYSWIILLTIVCMFWMLEGLHQSIVLINEKRVRLLEELLSTSVLPNCVPLHFHYIGGYKNITRKEKINAFFNGTFKSEIIAYFYIAMSIASILFIIFISPTKAENPSHSFYIKGI